MANYRLNETGGTDIQTTFRFAVHIAADAANSRLGLTEDVTGYIQTSDLPKAPGAPIVWHLPGGMKNHQAGKRTVQPVSMTFVVPTMPGDRVKVELTPYSLDKGTNIGKRNYCTDGISILVKGEDDTVKYKFRLLRAQVTECNYGAVNSESNDLIKVTCSFIYDDYKVEDGNGRELKGI